MSKDSLKIRQKNITDFYKTKNEVTLTSKSKKEEYISLITDDESSGFEDDLIIVEERIKSEDVEAPLKTCTNSHFFKANANEVANKYDENLFEEKKAILLKNLNEKPDVYRPTLNEEIQPNKSSQKIPSYRIHQFPECEDKITIDFFPKNSQTIYHFISHLHSDHHVGFSKKWLVENPHAILVFGEENYLPFLYKFNIVNFKSKVKGLEDDYEAITSRILVIRKNNPLKLFLNDGNSYILVKTLNANHCIGACLLLFEYYNDMGQLKETVLHTGDFRYNSKMMLPKLKNTYFDKIYLDTTYKSPVWNFTPKDELLEKVSDFLQLKLKPAIIDSWFQKGRIQRTLDTFVKNITFDKKSLKTLIVLGSYTIGKGVFGISADVVNDLKESFKDHDTVLYLGSIGNPKEIKQKLKLFNVERLFGKMITICISLSGWNFYKWKNFFQDMENVEELPVINKSNCFRVLEEFNDNSYIKRKYELEEVFNSDLIFDDNFEVDLEKLPKWIITQDKLNRIVYWKLSYSDHSSYKELSQCCTELNYGEIIPTVNTHSMELLEYHMNLWKLCNISKK
ncbi:unnamed protein product [Hanseniaspora opuntiae]